jgi:PD-(D/E)XK nuclease superfamily
MQNTNTKFQRANAWSKIVIGVALEVHSLKGAGLIESIHERCMLREFELRKIQLSLKDGIHRLLLPGSNAETDSQKE